MEFGLVIKVEGSGGGGGGGGRVVVMWLVSRGCGE